LKGEDRVCFWTYGQQTDLTGAAQFCRKLNMTLPIITEDTDVRYGHRSLFYRYLRSSPAVVRNSRLWLGLHKNRWTAEWNWLNRTDEQLTLSPANITGSLSVCLSFFLFSVFFCFLSAVCDTYRQLTSVNTRNDTLQFCSRLLFWKLAISK